MSTQSDVADVLRTVAGGAAALASALPEPAGMVVRILGAAAGAASVAIDAGKTEAEVVAAIHRIRRIDTAEDDAEVDAAIAALPTRESPPAIASLPAEAQRVAGALLAAPAASRLLARLHALPAEHVRAIVASLARPVEAE